MEELLLTSPLSGALLAFGGVWLGRQLDRRTQAERLFRENQDRLELEVRRVLAALMQAATEWAAVRERLAGGAPGRAAELQRKCEVLLAELTLLIPEELMKPAWRLYKTARDADAEEVHDNTWDARNDLVSAAGKHLGKHRGLEVTRRYRRQVRWFRVKFAVLRWWRRSDYPRLNE